MTEKSVSIKLGPQVSAQDAGDAAQPFKIYGGQLSQVQDKEAELKNSP